VLEHQNERSPSQDEIAEGLGMENREVSNAIRISKKHQSLDTPFRDGEKNSLIDVVKDEGQEIPERRLMGESLQQEVKDALSTLKDREQEVIKMYFGIDREYPLTLNEIGEEFNLTRERVRQIKERAIKRLRHKSRSTKLKVYLG
jgi:RNA polymerase primary sigma factor